MSILERDDMRRVKRPLRVLCVGGDYTPYGAVKAQLTLLEALHKTQIDPTVYFLKGSVLTEGLSTQLPRLEFGIPPAKHIRSHIPEILWDLVIHARRSDVVFSMLEGPPLYLSAVAAKMSGRKLVSWMHNNWEAVTQSSKSYHTRLSRIVFPAATLTVCVSEGVERALIEFCPTVKGRTTTIKNAVNADKINELADQRLPDWSSGVFLKPTILAVGRLEWQKGYDILLKSIAEVRAQGLDVNLLILGEGRERCALEEEATSLGIRDCVFMPGFVQNPFPFYRKASLLALSSRFEGLPTVLIEALVLGTPTVAFDCPSGAREILDGGQNGRLVRPGDHSAMASELADCLQHPEYNLRMSERGKSSTTAYQVAPVVEEFQRLFERVCSVNPGDGLVKK